VASFDYFSFLLVKIIIPKKKKKKGLEWVFKLKRHAFKFDDHLMNRLSKRSTIFLINIFISCKSPKKSPLVKLQMLSMWTNSLLYI
jgi:hypothetical protein